LIGGLDACFQLTDPGETLSSTSNSIHLQTQLFQNQVRELTALMPALNNNGVLNQKEKCKISTPTSWQFS
jgi:argininosuccinate lyase